MMCQHTLCSTIFFSWALLIAFAARAEAIEEAVEIDAATGEIVASETLSTVHSNDVDESDDVPSHLEQCEIWLAPSAIPGAGLGMYAGRDFTKGEYFQAMGDVVIPIIDRYMHNGRDDNFFLFDAYTWNGHAVDMDFEGIHVVDGVSPGFGSTANSFLPVVNVEENYPSRGNGGLHRSKDPGAGAFTEYYDRQSTATRHIRAGEELYVNYGSHWFVDRLALLGPIPLEGDLDRATQLYLAHEKLKESVKHDVVDNLWDYFVRNTTFIESRVIASFRHDDPAEWEEMNKLKSLKQIRLNEATKTKEWLYEHGTCGDHLYGAQSTIEQAGRGAFASRALPKGTVVSHLPLVHMTNRSHLDMFHFDNMAKYYRAKRTGTRPPQMLLNYCYGHGESSMLLCPYGPVASYVNHNQTRANLRLRWADPEKGNLMPELLEQSMDVLDSDKTAKLAFEMVATRDIAKDEECFLDYGDAWEEAWQQHVASWKPVVDADEYQYFKQFAEELDKAPYHLTKDELEENPLPPNIEMKCSSLYWTDFWEDMSFREKEAALDEYEAVPCQVIARNPIDESNKSFVYDAVSLAPQHREDPVAVDLPDNAFEFFEKPYSSDLFLENAFRHDMRIPDDIFPSSWRNQKK